MSPPRLSIAGLMGLVLFVAVGLAALWESTEVWERGVFGASLLLLTASVALAACRVGRARAFWIGFALFGWTYLVASSIPSVQARLPTTWALSALANRWPKPASVITFDTDGMGDAMIWDRGTLGSFLGISHSLLSLILAYLGGVFSASLHDSARTPRAARWPSASSPANR